MKLPHAESLDGGGGGNERYAAEDEFAEIFVLIIT